MPCRRFHGSGAVTRGTDDFGDAEDEADVDLVQRSRNTHTYI